MQVRLASQ
jgi:hypothetical protein